MLEIYNEWELQNGEWVEVDGALQMFSSTPLEILMEEGSLNNQYKAVFSIPFAGRFSLVVRPYETGQGTVAKWNNNDFSGDSIESVGFTSLEISDINNLFTDDCVGNCAYKFTFKLKPLATGTIKFTFKSISNGLYFINNEYMALSLQGDAVISELDMDSSELYDVEIHLFQSSGVTSNISLQWAEGSNPAQSISSNKLHIPSSDALTLSTRTTYCHDGFSTEENGDLTTWEIVWGDGFKNKEEWDDGNLDDGDGWDSSCKIEDGYACNGGALTEPDEWFLWANEGRVPSSSKSSCIDRWGDERKSGSEECDDGNTQSNDGWDYQWEPERNYIWLGGGVSSKSIWTRCPDAETNNLEHTEWGPVWGDGLKHDTEEWDDDNLSSTVDGCTSQWKINDGYVCYGGTVTKKDTWIRWLDGSTPNSDKDECIVVWGDGLKHQSEECEDGNDDNNDGCNSSCKIGENCNL